MSSPKLVERFPALFWTPDEFDSPDTESVRPIRVPLLKRIEGPSLTSTDKAVYMGVDPAVGKSKSGILLAHPGPPMETVDPGDPQPTVDIQKVGAHVLTDLHLDEDGNLQGTVKTVGDLPEVIQKWLEEKAVDNPPIIVESTPHKKGPADPVVTVKTVGDFMDFYNKQIAEGLAVPKEYWNPEAETNKGIMAQVCADCLLFGGAYLDPLSGNPVSVNCMSKCVAADSAAWKFFQESAGIPCPCVYYEPKDDPKGN